MLRRLFLFFFFPFKCLFIASLKDTDTVFILNNSDEQVAFMVRIGAHDQSTVSSGNGVMHLKLHFFNGSNRFF
ncbi:unnamed protein product, partial [Musa acuminata var. zebrina]